MIRSRMTCFYGAKRSGGDGILPEEERPKILRGSKQFALV